MHSSLSRSIASLAVSATFFGLGSMPAAQAGVVLGNLGADGSTGALSTTNSGITAEAKYAQAFTTPASSPDLLLASITLGAFTSEPESNPFSLQVFRSGTSAPGALFATSTNTQTLGTASSGALYTWNFDNVQMDPSTTYWIVPPTNLNWNFRSNFSLPTTQNGSGYLYDGLYFSTDGVAWVTEGGSGLATSVQAVPEPSTYCMALAGLACGGFSMWRRRRRA